MHREKDHHHPAAGTTASFAYSAGTALFACFMSTWVVMHNKYVVTNVFPNTNCLMFVQNVVSIVLLLGGRWCGVIPYFTVSLLEVGDLVSGVCYTTNVVAGLLSLKFLSVPVYQALKRCTVVVSWAIELFFSRKPTTMHAFPAIMVMVASTGFASQFDDGFVLAGYLLAFLSVVAQSSAFELGRRVAETKNRGICAVLVANAFVALVYQTVTLLATGELVANLAPSVLTLPVVFHLVLNAVSCLMLNYSIFLNCTVNSPLAHTVTGNMKTAATTLLSVAFFDSHLSFWGWCGILGNFSGAAWFSWIKMPKMSHFGDGENSHGRKKVMVV